MAYLNRTQLIGNLCKDPVAGKLPNGIVYSAFTIGMTEKYHEKRNYSYFKVKSFGKVGALCNKFLYKGCLIFVEGRLIVKRYQRPGEEVWNHTYEIYADRMQLLSRPGGKREWDDQRVSELATASAQVSPGQTSSS